MSFLQLSENEGSSMYIQFVFKDGEGKSNDEIIEAKYFMIHPDFKTGFSKYENGVYKNMWDQKVGVRPDNYKELLADGYARSFWCRVLIKDKGVLFGQGRVFLKAKPLTMLSVLHGQIK